MRAGTGVCPGLVCQPRFDMRWHEQHTPADPLDRDQAPGTQAVDRVRAQAEQLCQFLDRQQLFHLASFERGPSGVGWCPRAHNGLGVKFGNEKDASNRLLEMTLEQ